MRLEWWCQRIESNSPVLGPRPTHPIRDEYLAAWPIRARHLNVPRFQWLTWKERKLGPNFADKPKWTQLQPQLLLWRTEERSKLFSSRPSYILPWPEPTFATDCKNIQNFPHLKTIKSKLLLWNIHIFQLRPKKNAKMMLLLPSETVPSFP